MRSGIRFFALLLPLSMPAFAEDYVPACPPSVEAFDPVPAAGQTLNCMCLTRPADEISDVWGTDIYTADSDICSAAQHAGATRPGMNNSVRLKVIAGCDAYEGSSANGVITSTFESYNRSFFFPGYGDSSEAVNCKNSEADLPPPPPAQIIDTLPPPPAAAPEAEKTETPAYVAPELPLDNAAPMQGTGLGWHGTAKASNHYVAEFGGVKDVYDADVAYILNGSRYSANASMLYVSSGTASDGGWFKITTSGTASETGDLQYPIAHVDAQRRGGLTLPGISVTVTKVTEGMTASGERIHLSETADITLPDTIVGSAPDAANLPLSGAWRDSYTPAPANADIALTFKPWSAEWDLQCDANCVTE